MKRIKITILHVIFVINIFCFIGLLVEYSSRTSVQDANNSRFNNLEGEVITYEMTTELFKKFNNIDQVFSHNEDKSLPHEPCSHNQDIVN